MLEFTWIFPKRTSNRTNLRFLSPLSTTPHTELVAHAPANSLKNSPKANSEPNEPLARFPAAYGTVYQTCAGKSCISTFDHIGRNTSNTCITCLRHRIVGTLRTRWKAFYSHFTPPGGIIWSIRTSYTGSHCLRFRIAGTICKIC